MPKFFKQNILAENNPTSQTEAQNNTGETFPDQIDQQPTQPVTFQNFTEHALPIDAPTEINFPLPKDDEPLLPSPLDTPELPEHATPANNNFVENSTGHSEQPSTSLPNNPTPITLPNGDALPESKMVETLLSWKAASRPHRKRNRSFYTTVAILIILIAMIALLAGERMLVAVLFALMFLVYVLNFIEPNEIEYKLSTQGVTIDEHFYHWQELDSFWFEKKDGFTVLHILTQLRFPAMLMLVFGENVTEEQVKKIVARFLPFHEIAPKSLIDKWGESLQKYFPLENPHK